MIPQDFIICCPMCGTWEKTQYVELQNGMVSIMCWDECGMDYDVNGMWFFLNRMRRGGDEE